jgi:hypothetical protein
MVRMQTDFEKSLDQVGSEGWDDVKVIESATADGVVTRPLP